jgi:ubiquinone/menaquinone biosynthesis C-methylase UbiE
LLSNPFGIALYFLLRNDWAWKLLSADEKEIINQANREHNVERHDYKNPEEYGAERVEGGDNWDNSSIENRGKRGDELQRLLEKFKPVNVLEIGPGGGLLTKQIASYDSVSHLTLLDLGQAFLDFLHPRLESLRDSKPGFTFDLLVQDAKDISGEDQVYDMVFLSSAVHHIPDRTALFSNLSRLMKPGGVVVCFDPSHYFERLVRLSKRIMKSGYIKKSYYMNRTNLSTHQMCTYGEYKSICKSTGAFEVEDVSYVPSIKLGTMAKISKRWASTEIYVTLRRI